MPPKRKWTIDFELEQDGLHGVQRVKGLGTYQANQKRLAITTGFYGNRDGSEPLAVGGKKRISFTLSTIIPESNPKWEFHQDEFDKIIDNEAETFVRKMIEKLHNSNERSPDVFEGGMICFVEVLLHFSLLAPLLACMPPP
jgi:hypothetical protein